MQDDLAFPVRKANLARVITRSDLTESEAIAVDFTNVNLTRAMMADAVVEG